MTGLLSQRRNKGLAFMGLGIMNLEVSIAENAVQKLVIST